MKIEAGRTIEAGRGKMLLGQERKGKRERK